MTVTVKDDIYFIVEQAIDYAFEKKKFLLNFYDYLKSSKITGIDVKEFNNSSTASELTEVIHELDLLENGPKSLSQSWVMGALNNKWMKIKGYKYPEPPDCQSSFKEWEEKIKDHNH